jgi:hypothetical protein
MSSQPLPSPWHVPHLPDALWRVILILALMVALLVLGSWLTSLQYTSGATFQFAPETERPPQESLPLRAALTIGEA